MTQIFDLIFDLIISMHTRKHIGVNLENFII